MRSRPVSSQSPTLKRRTAPALGLDYRKQANGLKRGQALVLDDWICTEDGITTRKGFDVIAQLPKAVTQLLSYPSQLFCCTDKAIYNAKGKMQVAYEAGGNWQAATLSNDGGTHMMLCNGSLTPYRYDGKTWHIANISFLDAPALGADQLFSVTRHKRHFFFAQKRSLTVWYLPINAIGGEAHPIYLEAQFKKGGFIAAIGSLSQDGGTGRDDQLVIVSTKGEVAIYNGTDFDNDLSLVGVYTLPAPPIDKRAMVKTGRSLAVMTTKGLFALSSLAATDHDKKITSLTRKIDKRIIRASAVIESLSNEFMMIVDEHQQWILSATEGWSRFTGFKQATCFVEHDDGAHLESQLYFGMSDGRICQYGADNDADAPIRSFFVDAPLDYGSRNIKRFTRIRAEYEAHHRYIPRMKCLTDMKIIPEDFDAAEKNNAYWSWQDAKQSMPWIKPHNNISLQSWRGIRGHGVSAALVMTVQTRSKITFTGYDLIFEKGGAL